MLKCLRKSWVAGGVLGLLGRSGMAGEVLKLLGKSSFGWGEYSPGEFWGSWGSPGDAWKVLEWQREFWVGEGVLGWLGKSCVAGEVLDGWRNPRVTKRALG